MAECTLWLPTEQAGQHKFMLWRSGDRHRCAYIKKFGIGPGRLAGVALAQGIQTFKQRQHTPAGLGVDCGAHLAQQHATFLYQTRV